MSAWADPGRWKGLRSGELCPICAQREPFDVLAEFETTWLTCQERAPVRGYVCLVSKRHYVELHDLPAELAARFMNDAQRVSRAVSAVTGAVKLNYEIHGNSIPHLHMHFYPRYVSDQFEGGPIDPKRVRQPVYATGEFQGYRAALLAALDAAAY